MGATVSLLTMYATVPHFLDTPADSSYKSFCYLSLTGLFFVGVGDSTAALTGRISGQTRWWFGSHKTTEGSTWCFFSVQIGMPLVLFIFNVIQDVSIRIVELVFAVFITTVVEALTWQFDNFICSVLMFSLTTVLHYYYEVYIFL